MTHLRPTMTAAVAALLGGTAVAQDLPVIDGAGLDLISELRLPSDTALDGVPFGGISGLYPLGEGRYVALSDDRSEEGPARFYELASAKAF